MSPDSARVGSSSAEASAAPLPRAMTAARNTSTTSTWAASTSAAATWTASRPTRSSRPADQTSRVERRSRCHSRATERRWLRLSTWRSSGSTGSVSCSVTGPPCGCSPEQTLGLELGDEGRDVGHGRLPVDAVLLDERVGELVGGALAREQLGQVRAGGVRREVDRPFGVEDDELAVDLPPGDALAPQLHVRSSTLGDAAALPCAVAVFSAYFASPASGALFGPAYRWGGRPGRREARTLVGCGPRACTARRVGAPQSQPRGVPSAVSPVSAAPASCASSVAASAEASAPACSAAAVSCAAASSAGSAGDCADSGDSGLLGAAACAARSVAFSASRTVACFGLTGSMTSSMTAIGALSPLRGAVLVIRV